MCSNKLYLAITALFKIMIDLLRVAAPKIQQEPLFCKALHSENFYCSYSFQYYQITFMLIFAVDKRLLHSTPSKYVFESLVLTFMAAFSF